MGGGVEIGLTWLPHGKGLAMPAQQSAGAAGMDLMAALSEGAPLTIKPASRVMVPCGFSIALPTGYEAQVRPRSGLAAKYGVTVLNAPGTVDADYRGEIKVILINHGEADFVVRRGDRIAQMVVAPVSAVRFTQQETLDDTERGGSGFGSTGR